MTSQELAALKARRSLLSDQLNSANSRRKELAQQARNATGADKAGLEQRIAVLDGRLARLENDIDENSKLLASVPAALASTSSDHSVGIGPGAKNRMEDVIPVVSIVSLFVLFPIVLSIARNIWRRGSLPPAARPDRESVQRLERMEQAMEAIAIEVERVSEGQRFVTRLLSEQHGGGAIAAGQPAAEPVRAAPGEKARL
ncbi:MAG: hypothetical protein HOQ31_01445 [Gemmatimonadaceae bacterium]|nr:hypothetical protein [Gemmatimonadaceae bacterium]NUO93421.1 hypothetical protein [Gemmatimonadaceae bacterium]NUS46184.1 hypothetical protein [Gemmatimonadaceae bacterium]